MLTTNETIKLYLILNKLMYKHAELGKDIFSKQRNPDVDNPDFQMMLEISTVIEMLLDADDSILAADDDTDSVLYPNYLRLEGQDLDHFLDYLTKQYRLDPVPYLEFPKNTVNYIIDSNGVNIVSSGTQLPSGGGEDYYLTKDVSGNLVWKKITYLSNFDLI